MANKNVYRDMGKSIWSDECYTTSAESNKIIDYLIENGILEQYKTIWLPFDNELSNIYQTLKSRWNGNIILSNLEMGLDFYNYEPEEYDLIVSNPPFKGRTNLFNRLHYLNKPFIILQATQMFNNQFAINYLCEYSEKYQFILPRSRMNFLTHRDGKVKSTKNGAAFYSFWLCYNIGLKQTFNSIKDNGQEKEIEEYDEQGNPITDNHRNLFNLGNQL